MARITGLGSFLLRDKIADYELDLDRRKKQQQLDMLKEQYQGMLGPQQPPAAIANEMPGQVNIPSILGGESKGMLAPRALQSQGITEPTPVMNPERQRLYEDAYNAARMKVTSGYTPTGIFGVGEQRGMVGSPLKLSSGNYGYMSPTGEVVDTGQGYYDPLKTLEDPYGNILGYRGAPGVVAPVQTMPGQTQPQVPNQVPNQAPGGIEQTPFGKKEGYKFNQKLYEQQLSSLNKESEGISVHQNMIQDLNRFMYLNDRNRTGGVSGLPGVRDVRGMFDEEVAEMSSIVDKMTPMMRQGMPGAASDRDVAMFRGATVGMNKPPEANRNIANGLIAANQNKVDNIEFKRWYLEQNGSLKGAQQAWKEYLNSNPIFNPQAPTGSYQLNPNRATWDQYFIQGVRKEIPWEALSQ
jgi:hypothetical protein